MNTTQAQQKALDDAFVSSADRQVFEDLSLEHDILSFIRDLGHTGDITYLTDGMFHKKNIDYVYLLWEDLLFQIEYKDAKKTNKMSYPRFTKIIIDYFMSKDQSISRRNKMFWHTDRDDTIFTSMRCISRHEDTHVYGTILPRELTNQTMLESNAYQTYYAFAFKEKAPKPKYIRKKANSDTYPKKKHVQAAKGTRLKSKAKVAKPAMKKQPAKKTKAKGDGVDMQSKVPDEQQQKTSGTDEGTSTILGVPDVPLYKSKSDKESWGDSEDEDDNDDDGDNDEDDQTEHEEEDIDDRVRTPLEYELTDEEKLDDEETIDDQEDDEVIKELYGDVNVNLGNDDTEMTDADQGASEQQNVSQESGFKQEEEDAHLLNLENPSPTDNEIASLMETSACHATAIPELTSDFTTTTPPPTLFFNHLLQQQTPTFTTTTSINPIVTLPKILNFAFVFKFDQRLFALESEMFEFKQINQFAKAASSITGIVDTYLASKMKEAVDVVVQLQTNKLREEAQTENQEFLNQVDSIMKTIIKDQVKAQVSKIMPKIKKYVTESLGAEVLVRSMNQPQKSYAVAASLLEFKLKKILIDKMETNKSIDRSENHKNLYNVLVESYNSNKDIITSYGDVVILKRGQDDQDKGPLRWIRPRDKKKDICHTIKDSCIQQDQEFVMGDNNEQPADKEVTKAEWFKKPERPPTPDPDWNLEYLKGGDLSRRYSTSVTKTKADTYELKWIEDLVHKLWSPVVVKYDQHAYLGTSHRGPKCQSFYEYANNLTSSKDVYSRRRIIAVTRLTIMKKYDYGPLEEIEVRQDDQQLYTFKEGDFKRLHLQDIEDMLLLLVQQKLTNLTIDERYDLNVALRMLTRRIVIQRRVKDLQLGLESYQKKLNLTKPDTYRPNLRNKTSYTSYSDPHGIIYVDQFKRKRLMRTDELHKFSDGKLDDVRTVLQDIAAGIRMKYLPMRKWSNLDKKRARIMVQDIDKQLYQRRLMRNLEMFVGGRIYEKDLRLLERTI
ncbi:hypothetical protein Tco_0000235 [Tanacetum coccineum]